MQAVRRSYRLELEERRRMAATQRGRGGSVLRWIGREEMEAARRGCIRRLKELGG